MFKTIASAVVVAVLLTACTTPGPDTAERAEVLYREAVVETVDLNSREVLLTAENGNRASFVAGPEVRNLEQVEPGDKVRIGYYEGVAARMADPADPGGAIQIAAAERAELGERPAVATGTITNFVVELVSYNASNAIATFVTPDGVVHTALVHPRMRAFAEARKPGDRIELTIEQAVAISVEEI